MTMHSSRFFTVSIPLLATVVGVHQFRPAAAGARSHGLPVQSPAVLAEGTIDLAQERVLFPATVHGDTTTLILDLGTTGNLMSRAEGIRLKILGAESAETVELDSMTVGSSVRHHISFDMTDGAFGGAAILMGAPFQAEYDLMFDGPAHRARLYAQPKNVDAHESSAAKHQAWFPAGITPADCLPMGEDAQGFQRVFFPFQVNGHLVHSMFDSGSSSTNMNAYGARQVGLTVA
ncbi:MAG TPA: hypothetical protein VNU46_09210, partial [Gemmatimonadaceae bacterium]|nr:hypothetical protein [Gemmatimonadaceae bacterium]